MSAYQDRVRQERNELHLRYKTLTAFFQTDEFNNLPQFERSMLSRQHLAMTQYLDVLDERVSYFNMINSK